MKSNTLLKTFLGISIASCMSSAIAQTGVGNTCTRTIINHTGMQMTDQLSQKVIPKGGSVTVPGQNCAMVLQKQSLGLNFTTSAGLKTVYQYTPEGSVTVTVSGAIDKTKALQCCTDGTNLSCDGTGNCMCGGPC